MKRANNITRNYKKDGERHKKGWGAEYWLTNKLGGYCLKILAFEKGKKFSLHFHAEKEETFFVLSGIFELITIDTTCGEEWVDVIKRGDFVEIRKFTPHQIKCVAAGEIVEASTYHKDHDSYRIKPGDSQRMQERKKGY